MDKQIALILSTLESEGVDISLTESLEELWVSGAKKHQVEMIRSRKLEIVEYLLMWMLNPPRKLPRNVSLWPKRFKQSLAKTITAWRGNSRQAEIEVRAAYRRHEDPECKGLSLAEAIEIETFGVLKSVRWQYASKQMLNFNIVKGKKNVSRKK